jgi:uncharacterized protein
MKLAAAILAVIVSAATSVFAAETRLSIEGPSGALQGTLASPDGGPKAPVSIIIPGSGPTDRDGNNPLGVTAGSYRLLAEALAAKGVSTIRIDKRGLFGSSAAAADADNVRMSDLADDVRAWRLEAQKRTSAPCAWLIGHSEGSLVALITAQQPEGICGLILVAGAGRKMGDILREQLKANPANAPILAQALAAIDELEAGRRVDVGGMHPALMGLFRPSVQGFVIDQMSYDPAQLLARHTGPVLVLQGTTDLQISMQDAQRLAGARPGVTMVTLEGVNHILKIAPADPAANFATYGNSALPIAPSLVEAIMAFFAQHP